MAINQQFNRFLLFLLIFLACTWNISAKVFPPFRLSADCLAPSGLAVAGRSANELTVTWTSQYAAFGYVVYAVDSLNPSRVVATEMVTTNPVVLTNLEADHPYLIRAATLCGSASEVTMSAASSAIVGRTKAIIVDIVVDMAPQDPCPFSDCTPVWPADNCWGWRLGVIPEYFKVEIVRNTDGSLLSRFYFIKQETANNLKLTLKQGSICNNLPAVVNGPSSCSGGLTDRFCGSFSNGGNTVAYQVVFTGNGACVDLSPATYRVHVTPCPADQ